MCFVNRMDRIGADFYRTVDMVKNRLEAAAVTAPAGQPAAEQQALRRPGGPGEDEGLIWRRGTRGRSGTKSTSPTTWPTRPPSTRNCWRPSPPATTS
ncbi:MAG: hypothetical protein R2694_20835 [Ilumatobacteraceae bacterium]